MSIPRGKLIIIGGSVDKGSYATSQQDLPKNLKFFEKGILKVIKQATGKFQLVFASTFIQFYKHRKQSINVYLKNEADSYADKSISELKNAYQQHYDAVKKIQTGVVL